MTNQEHIAKLRELLSDGSDSIAQLTEASRYVKQVVFPAIAEQFFAVSMVPEHERLNSLRNLIDILCYLLNSGIRPAEWQDLAPIFTDAIIRFIDSGAESLFIATTPPEVARAGAMLNDRKRALAKKGMFTEDEVYSWWDGSGS